MDGRNAGGLRQVRPETSKGAGDVYGTNDACWGPAAPDAPKDVPGLPWGEGLRGAFGAGFGLKVSGDHRGTGNGVAEAIAQASCGSAAMRDTVDGRHVGRVAAF
jgi:hypothetical protein